MKILHKDGVKTICRDYHPNVEGWETLMLPDGYTITKMIQTESGEKEVVKEIGEIKLELEIT